MGFKRHVKDAKRNVTRDKRPDLYASQVYLSKDISEAIDFMARVNGVSRKQMVDDMLRLGIGHYFGARIAEHNLQTEQQRERGEPVRPTYFVIMLRHWAHLKGYDIGKFI